MQYSRTNTKRKSGKKKCLYINMSVVSYDRALNFEFLPVLLQARPQTLWHFRCALASCQEQAILANAGSFAAAGSDVASSAQLQQHGRRSRSCTAILVSLPRIRPTSFVRCPLTKDGQPESDQFRFPQFQIHRIPKKSESQCCCRAGFAPRS
jgi:hypothetical protein